MTDGWHVEGLPIENKFKIWGVLGLILLLIINHNLYMWVDYPYRNTVSLIFIGLMVLFSIGSVVAEAIILAIIAIGVVSNLWDFMIFDITLFRKQVLMGSIVVGIAVLSFGKISITNLIKILQNQLGVGK